MTHTDDPGADATRFYQPNDFIALELGRLAAARLDPVRLAHFRDAIQHLRELSGDTRYFRLWDRILEAGPDAVRRALVEPSERGQILRSVVSFRAFVEKQERDEIFARYGRRLTADRSR
jgi:hypothetical protein